MSLTINVLNETGRRLAARNTGARQWKTRRGQCCAILEEGDETVILLREHYQILECWFWDNDAGHRQLFIRVRVEKARRSRRIK